MKPIFDARDREILTERQAAFDKVSGPRVGDICYLLDGTTRRFTYDLGDSIQVTSKIDGKVIDGSFYFGAGYLDYSGGLDSPIKKHRFHQIGRGVWSTTATAWFFHHDMPMADNGVVVQVYVREYRETD